MRLLLLVLLTALTVYALIECLQSRADTVRLLPKPLWALVILALPLAGPALWWWSGRPTRATSSGPKPERWTLAPDDDPDFLRSLRRHAPPPSEPEPPTRPDAADSSDAAGAAETSDAADAAETSDAADTSEPRAGDEDAGESR